MTKWKHVFWNFNKFIGNEIQNYLIYIGIQPPESILCRSTFGSDYSFKSSWVCVYQLCKSRFGDFLPFSVADLLNLCQVGGGASVNRKLQVFPQILNMIQIWALAGPLKDFSHSCSEAIPVLLGLNAWGVHSRNNAHWWPCPQDTRLTVCSWTEIWPNPG